MSPRTYLAPPKWAVEGFPGEVSRPSPGAHAVAAFLAALVFGLPFGLGIAAATAPQIPYGAEALANACIAIVFTVISCGLFASFALPWPHGFSLRATAAVGSAIGLTLAVPFGVVSPLAGLAAGLPLAAAGALAGRFADRALAAAQRRRLARWREPGGVLDDVAPCTAGQEARRLMEQWACLRCLYLVGIVGITMVIALSILLGRLAPRGPGLWVVIVAEMLLANLYLWPLSVARARAAVVTANAKRAETLGLLLDRARGTSILWRTPAESGCIRSLFDRHGSGMVGSLSESQLVTLANVLARAKPQVWPVTTWAPVAMSTLARLEVYKSARCNKLRRRVWRSRLGRRLGPVTRAQLLNGS